MILIVDKDGAREIVLQKDGTELNQLRCSYCKQALLSENYPHQTTDVCAQYFHDSMVPALVKDVRRLTQELERERGMNPVWRWVRSWGRI